MHKIIFAGFGGQGIQTMSKLLCYAAMDNNWHVSWLPSYGPEMRGGTSNCSVIISDYDIDSPIITTSDVVVAMNNPSLSKFQSYIKSNGILIINSNMVTNSIKDSNLTILGIPCDDIAINELGNKAFSNMIILGQLVKVTNIISLESLIQSISIHSKPMYVDLNKKAVTIGYNLKNI